MSNGSTSVNKGFIATWLKGKSWLYTGKSRGPTRTCRICDTKLGRFDWYLNLDNGDHRMRIPNIQNSTITRGNMVSRPIQITICEHCVDKWAKELHKLNNGIQRNSTSEC